MSEQKAVLINLPLSWRILDCHIAESVIPAVRDVRCVRDFQFADTPVIPAKSGISSIHRFTPRDSRFCGNDRLNENDERRGKDDPVRE